MVCIIAWMHLSERIIPALGRSHPGKHGCYPAYGIVCIKATSNAKEDFCEAAEENLRL